MSVAAVASERLRTVGLLVVAAFTLAAGISALVEPVSASPATYYVRPSGNDSAPGTAAQPLRTLDFALRTLNPGDTLVVGGGTYVERVRNPSINPGLPGARITVVAAPGERPVVQGLFWLKGASYWTVDGVNVTWGSSNAGNEHMVKFSDGTGWRYTNAEVWGARSFAGILVAGDPSEWRLDHLYVHDTYRTNDTNQDHLIYVNTGMGGGIIERNVLAHSANGRAVKIGPSSPGSTPRGNVTVRYNTMFDNRGPSNVQLSYGASGNEVYRNLMVGSGAGNANTTAYNLNGSANTVSDNVGWDSARVADPDAPLGADSTNRWFDPQLRDPARGDFRPANAAAAPYGAHAAGDNAPVPAPTTTAPPTTTTTITTAPTTTTTTTVAPTTTTTVQPPTTTVTTSPPPTSTSTRLGSPVLRGATTVANLASLEIVLTVPQGTVAGDLLIATLDVRGSGPITAPAGWQLLRSDASGTALAKQTWIRVAGSAEPASYRWGFAKARAATGALLAYSGVNAASPVGSAAGTVGGRARAVAAPAANAGAGTTVVVLFGFANDAALQPSAPLVERAEVASATTEYTVTTSVADQAGTGGSTGPFLATADATAVGIGHTLVLNGR